MLDEWYTYFHQCSQCRRCSVFCPYGIDTAEISMAARDIMDSVGLGQKYSNEIIGKVHKIGNNLGLPPNRRCATRSRAWKRTSKEETGVDVRLPLDEKGAEVLLVTPSADFFAEPHIDGLIGYAKVFHAAGISWTLSLARLGGGQFRLFIGNHDNLQKVAQRIREAALDLGVKRIVVGECGHAWRVAYSFWNTLIGPFDFLDPRYPVPQHICEFTYDLIQRGALTLDKSANDDNGRHLPRFLQRRRAPRAWATCRAGSSRSRATIIRACVQQVLRHGARDHPRGDLLLRRRRRAAHRRPDGAAREGRAAAHAGAARGRRRARRQLHGRDLRHLQERSSPRCCRTTGIRMDMIGSVHQMVSNAIVLRLEAG